MKIFKSVILAVILLFSAQAHALRLTVSNTCTDQGSTAVGCVKSLLNANGTTNPHELYFPAKVIAGTPYTVTTSVAVPANYSVTMDRGSYFAGAGQVTFDKGSIRTVSTTWWGLSSTATDAVNAAALASAISSLAPIIETPAGNYSYSGTGLVFNRAIRFDGAGGVGEASPTGADGATPSLTKFIYSGTGVGMTLLGTIANSTENIHLSNFLLYGNANAVGGIDLGGATSATLVTKGSLKNVKVSFFNKTSSYGIRFRQVLEFLLENTYANFNYDGMVSKVGDTATTVLITSSFARENDRHGVDLRGTFAGSTFLNFVSESNKYAGLHIENIDVASVNFINWWSENNLLTGGDEPIEIGTDGGTSPFALNFIGGQIGDSKNGANVSLLAGFGCTFTNIGVVIQLLANQVGGIAYCSIVNPLADITSVKNNRFGKVSVNGIWFETLITNAIVPLPAVIDGIIYASTFNDNAWYAIYGIKQSSGAIVEQLNVGSNFQATVPADNAGKIGIYYASSAYHVKNSTTGTLTIQVKN